LLIALKKIFPALLTTPTQCTSTLLMPLDNKMMESTATQHMTAEAHNL